MPEFIAGNVSVLYGDEIVFLQPANGTFFHPRYAAEARQQFAAQIAHLPEDKRPTLVVLEDVFAPDLPAHQVAKTTD